MGADHGGNAAVQVPTHGHFFAGEFGVEIDKPDLYAGVEFLENAIRLAERAIGAGHVHAALQIDHRHLDAVPGLHRDHAQARQFFGIIGWTQQPRLAGHVVVNFFLIEDMIAGGEHVQADAEQFLGDLGSDSEAAGRVLGVGDRQVDFLLRDHFLQVVGYDIASRRRENIANKKDVHGKALRKRKVVGANRPNLDFRH